MGIFEVPIWKVVDRPVKVEGGVRQTYLLDWRSFPKLVGQIIRGDGEFAGVGYSSDLPDKRAETPHIAYSLVHRLPGAQGIESQGPRHRMDYLNEDGSITQVKEQWMTCLYQWDCCAHTGEEAEEMVWKLDQLLKDSRPLFLSHGITHAHFAEQLQDGLLPRTHDVKVRSLRWRVVVPERTQSVTPRLDEIQLRVLAARAEEVEEVVRASDLQTPDRLSGERISTLLAVSSASSSGIARDDDFQEGVDFKVLRDLTTGETMLGWLEAGRKPAAGETYYVRYLRWTEWVNMFL